MVYYPYGLLKPFEKEKKKKHDGII